MPEYLAGATADIPEGGKLVVACGEVEIGIFKVGGTLYAWHNQCAHRQGPVCQGRIFHRVIEPLAPDRTVRMLAYDETAPHIVCPWHGYEFDLRTGEHPGSRTLRLRPARLRIEDDMIYVML
jgi:nitrite reductase/ring-hydroxylating ferredoxin subunit